MARKGRKGLSSEIKKARGEYRPSQHKIETLFKNHAARPDPENLPPPAWLSSEAKTIWRGKINIYRQRGQKIDGFQAALAQYCQLEAQMIKEWSAGIPPTASTITQYRTFAAEFYDTPAAQKVPAGGGSSETNRFTNNGRKKP